MKYMLLIYGNEEAFSSVGAEAFAEILRETDALNQELFESGELVGAYGVADQVNAKMVRVTPDVYLTMNDYYHEPTMQVDAGALEKMQEFQIKAGFQKKSADVKSLVDLGYLPQ